MQKTATRLWTVLLVFGLIGQIAWSVENMYFNLFVYNTVAKDTQAVTRMVQFSGIAATLTTIIMGAVTDRAGNRKYFISIGYLIWGVTVMAFAAITKDNVASAFKITDPEKVVTVTIAIIIAMDCIMTFFGSTANDAAFNAWVTDNTTANIRGKTESVLSALPLIGMLIVAGGFGMIVESIGYSGMFLLLGGLICLSGVFGLFFIKDSPALIKNRKKFMSELVYGFKPSTVKTNKKLYLLFVTIGIYGIATQIFMPYIIIFMQEYLGFDTLQYSIVLGVVILLASAAVIVTGRFTDKRSKTACAALATVFMIAGLAAFYAVAKCGLGLGSAALIVLCIVTALVMIYGYIMILALIGAMIRDRTPEDQAGKLQGVRLIFYVLLPMFIGPMIGEAINSASGLTYIDPDSGALAAVPSAEIFIAAAAVALLIFVPLFLFYKTRGSTVKLDTDYVQEDIPLSDYPRPQLVRDSYLNLNGKWHFTGGGYDGDITVPYSPETLLSGTVGFKRKKGDVYVYSRKFVLPYGFIKDHVILHFGAVDNTAKVSINGVTAVEHTGGYLPFYADITELIKDGENELTVTVTDDRNGGAFGKQKIKAGGIWYTDTCGIWQTVWLESVPEKYIRSVRFTPDLSGVFVDAEADDECVVRLETGESAVIKIGERVRIDIANPKLWTPDSPKLYRATVTCGKDSVSTYFSLRTFSVGESNGKKRLHLNGKPYFINAVLDQGYYSDGMYTPKNYAAFRDDIEFAKALGFNCLRKHAKIEPQVWYAMCDELGMIVWQDIVNGGGDYKFSTVAVLPFLGKTLIDDKYKRFARDSEQSRAMFERELNDTVDVLYNFPCICMWTLFNEGWGQFDGARLTEVLRLKDGTRVIDSASGWHDCGGELCSLHTYFKRLYMPDDSRPIVISEFGGYAAAIKDHMFAPDKTFGYKRFEDSAALKTAVSGLYKTQIAPLVQKGLSGCCYTQLSDVEEEVNGLVTFDRKVRKINEPNIFAISDYALTADIVAETDNVAAVAAAVDAD